MPLRDFDDEPAVEECWRCHSRNASTLRRLTVSHLSRFVIVERVLCRDCLVRLELVVKEPFEAVVEAQL